MAPKRAFGGVLRPFGGGFRGPNRERASVFSSAGRGAERGSSAVQEGRGRAGGSAVEPGRDQRVQRRGTGRCRWFCGGARRRSQRVQRRRTGAVQGVLRWSPEAEPACSAAQDGGGAGGSAVEPGRGQRVQRWGPVRDGGGTGGGSAAQAGAGPACSAARDRGGTGSSEVQTGRAGRRVAKKVFRREDAPAARTQKKCSEGKVRRRPNTYGHKKTDLGPFTSTLPPYYPYPATLRAVAPGCSSDTPCRTTTAPHSGSPSLLRETSGSMFSCNSLSAFDFGLPVGRGSQP